MRGLRRAAADATPPEGRPEALPPEDSPAWSGRGWIEGGGTAVVFLPPKLRAGCASIAGVPLPPRVRRVHTRDQGGAEPQTGEWRVNGIGAETLVNQQLAGRIAPAPRQLSTSGLRTFKTRRGLANCG